MLLLIIASLSLSMAAGPIRETPKPLGPTQVICYVSQAIPVVDNPNPIPLSHTIATEECSDGCGSKQFYVDSAHDYFFKMNSGGGVFWIVITDKKAQETFLKLQWTQFDGFAGIDAKHSKFGYGFTGLVEWPYKDEGEKKTLSFYCTKI